LPLKVVKRDQNPESMGHIGETVMIDRGCAWTWPEPDVLTSGSNCRDGMVVYTVVVMTDNDSRVDRQTPC
jgi:hypothetical protein